MKKLLAFLFVIIISITAILPTPAYAAKIKINKTKIVMIEGDTYKLKLNSTVDVTWKSTKESVATVNSKGIVTAVSVGKAVIKASTATKTYSCKITVKENDVRIKLNEINEFALNDLWNNNICSISDYINVGLDSDLQPIDLSKVLEGYQNSLAQMSEYSDYIYSLSGEKYDELKIVWADLYNAASRLYDVIASNPPKANEYEYNFDVSDIQEYRRLFNEEITFVFE